LRYRDETMPRYDVAHFGFAPLLSAPMGCIVAAI
jgi:hypothetical protein